MWNAWFLYNTAKSRRCTYKCKQCTLTEQYPNIYNAERIAQLHYFGTGHLCEVGIMSPEGKINSTLGDIGYTRTIQINDQGKTQHVYNIRIQSPYFMTQGQIKRALGVGFNVLSLEAERDLPDVEITNIDDAYKAIIQTGFRALARAHHPDLGGDPDKMVLINRAKKELKEILDTL